MCILNMSTCSFTQIANELISVEKFLQKFYELLQNEFEKFGDD